MQRNAGFTLLELMISISIVAILTAIAVPSFDFLNNRRITQTQVENLQRALSMARQSAVVNNRLTVVCPSASGTSCDDAASWSKGFMVYENRDSDAGFGNADHLLEYIPGVRNIVGRQSSDHMTHQLISDHNRAAFTAQGITTDWQTFSYCDGNNEKKFEIVLANTGRIKVIRSSGSC